MVEDGNVTHFIVYNGLFYLFKVFIEFLLHTRFGANGDILGFLIHGDFFVLSYNGGHNFIGRIFGIYTNRASYRLHGVFRVSVKDRQFILNIGFGGVLSALYIKTVGNCLPIGSTQTGRHKIGGIKTINYHRGCGSQV